MMGKFQRCSPAVQKTLCVWFEAGVTRPAGGRSSSYLHTVQPRKESQLVSPGVTACITILRQIRRCKCGPDAHHRQRHDHHLARWRPATAAHPTTTPPPSPQQHSLPERQGKLKHHHPVAGSTTHSQTRLDQPTIHPLDGAGRDTHAHAHTDAHHHQSISLQASNQSSSSSGPSRSAACVKSGWHTHTPNATAGGRQQPVACDRWKHTCSAGALPALMLCRCCITRLLSP